MRDTHLSDNVQLILFAAALVIFFMLLRPLLIIFISSILLTYLFHPVYRGIKKILRLQWLSVLLTLILIIVVFLLPIAFIASQLPGQVSYIYDYAKSNLIGQGYFDFSCNENGSFLCSIIGAVANFEYLEIDAAIKNVLEGTVQVAGGIVRGIPGFVVSIAFALFISFFLFRDGEKIAAKVVQMLPLHKDSSEKLVRQFGKVTHSVVFAHLIVALVQGTIGGLAFFLLGIPSPLFWGVVMSTFGLLPVIGSAIVWVPASIFLIASGIITGSYLLVGKGIVIILIGIFAISTIDNILRVKIVGSSEVHPLSVFIGLIGGVSLFGLMGIFIGPILFSLIVSYLGDFSKRYKRGEADG